MPDAAFRSTERQFTALLHAAAARRIALTIHKFVLPSVKRSEYLAAYVQADYSSFEELLGQRFDALVVTGNEPRADRLDREPYWRDLTTLVEWATTQTKSSLWSCLAAHAAVLHLHGIQRRPRSHKLSGIYECEVAPQHVITRGLPPRIAVPHSRWNALGRDDLLRNGYEILSESTSVGVDAFALRRRSQFVFMQGHPEYESDTLLREYRRDVGRFLRNERAEYPAEPDDYFSVEASAVLRAFRRRAEANRSPSLFEVFPNVASPFAIRNRWERTSAMLFGNWLDGIAATQASEVAEA